MLTLYFAPRSSSMAPHIALHEVGAAFEARPLSSRRRENRTPEYLALNPEGKVPTLLVDVYLSSAAAEGWPCVQHRCGTAGSILTRAGIGREVVPLRAENASLHAKPARLQGGVT